MRVLWMFSILARSAYFLKFSATLSRDLGKENPNCAQGNYDNRENMFFILLLGWTDTLSCLVSSLCCLHLCSSSLTCCFFIPKQAESSLCSTWNWTPDVTLLCPDTLTNSQSLITSPILYGLVSQNTCFYLIFYLKFCAKEWESTLQFQVHCVQVLGLQPSLSLAGRNSLMLC